MGLKLGLTAEVHHATSKVTIQPFKNMCWPCGRDDFVSAVCVCKSWINPAGGDKEDLTKLSYTVTNYCIFCIHHANTLGASHLLCLELIEYNHISMANVTVFSHWCWCDWPWLCPVCTTTFQSDRKLRVLVFFWQTHRLLIWILAYKIDILKSDKVSGGLVFIFLFFFYISVHKRILPTSQSATN